MDVKSGFWIAGRKARMEFHMLDSKAGSKASLHHDYEQTVYL
jgi:hypothetical protein